MRGPRPPLYPDSINRWLQARNRENLVYIRFNELVKVRKNASRPNLPIEAIRNLKNMGILFTLPPQQHKYKWTYWLTPWTLRVLDDMMENGGGSHLYRGGA